MLRSWILLGLCMAPAAVHAQEPAKKTDDVWAKIIVAFVTPEMRLAFDRKGFGSDDFVGTIPKELGGEGKFSFREIREKFGPPAKVRMFGFEEGKDAKVVFYEEVHYPPISFWIPVGRDQATHLGAAKRLWMGKGILENAKEALKAK